MESKSERRRKTFHRAKAETLLEYFFRSVMCEQKYSVSCWEKGKPHLYITNDSE